MKEPYYILILPSVHFVMKVEKDALAGGVAVDLVPTPRQISSDCGMAVKFREPELDWILREMSGEGMPEGMIYVFREGGFAPAGPAGNPAKDPARPDK
jgi:hypothetical protein